MSDFLQPGTVYPTPLAGLSLVGFVQAWVAGLTALDGTVVRPAYQGEPPNIPAAGTVWAAIQLTRRVSDAFPYVVHTGATQTVAAYDSLLRHETLDVLVSFYDLGIGGVADAYAELFRDGAAIEQNRWVLQQNGWGLVGEIDLLPVPTLVKERWQYRVDASFQLRREIRRSYGVNDIAEAQFNVIPRPAITEPALNFTLAGNSEYAGVI